MHVNTVRTIRALNGLYVLVQHELGHLVHKCLGDISGEIIAICQQMTGNKKMALYVYKHSPL